MNPNKNRRNKYDRVMPRVFNPSCSSMKSSSGITRHEIPSTLAVGAKPSVSNVSSSVFSELPTILNDYVPDDSRRNVKKKVLVKPRRTIKSLKPAVSPARSPYKPQNIDKECKIKALGSAPSVLKRDVENWSESHVKTCFSSRSHSKLIDLKDEIKAFHEKDKLMKFRSNLYKTCGVVLNDIGLVAEDKAVQVEDKGLNAELDLREEQRDGGRQAVGATVPDEQMRVGTLQYPISRYLVESSKPIEMINIIDDDIWTSEPALKPEDEIMLRKLHEMLQSTADDLKQLTKELSKLQEPGVQVKTAPTPLDEEFNEKVHIEEIVNAKFHGYKIIDKNSQLLKPQPNKIMSNAIKPVVDELKQPNVNSSCGAKKYVPILKKPRNINLGLSKTKTIQIDGSNHMPNESKKEIMNNGKVFNSKPTVSYNEFHYKYSEPNIQYENQLRVQNMPSINIRGELKMQQVCNLDIYPDSKNNTETIPAKTNVSVIALKHNSTLNDTSVFVNPAECRNKKPIVRKISKISCDSSGSANSTSDTQINIKTQQRLLSSIKPLSKNTDRPEHVKKKDFGSKIKPENRSYLDLNEWKKRLNDVYGPSCSKEIKSPQKPQKNIKKQSTKLSKCKSTNNALNNAEYIPYSQLTVGGVKASDIEKEIKNKSSKSGVPLNRQNFGNKGPPFKPQDRKTLCILTTSDENLLQEVIDIEKTVTETLSKNLKKKENESIISSQNTSCDSNDSYADDFEDDKSDLSDKLINEKHINKTTSGSDTTHKKDDLVKDAQNNNSKDDLSEGGHNETYIKILNLSFKNTIDVFEYVHSVDTQETATQSSTSLRLLPSETQTSPRNEKQNLQSIHNDLWPIDTRGELEKMFKLEKDFIKKLIFDEYGDLFERNLNKPSCSNNTPGNEINVSASQKNTQTSPARVKSVMTSPPVTKTRTTSPFASLQVDHQTSPVVLETKNEELNPEFDDKEDLGISINLSSPKFSLRLPQTFREVKSNLDHNETAKTYKKEHTGFKIVEHSTVSSSSLYGDLSSSEISSLGEVKLKLKRKLRKCRVPSISESSTSSGLSKYSSGLVSGSILPLKSEGEISIGQVTKNKNTSYGVMSISKK